MIIHYYDQKRDAEKPSFELVYQEYYQPLLRYLMKKTGNLQDAEDLTAEAFLYCYQNYDQYDPARSAVSTWLYLAANSRLKNYYRDRKDHVELSELEERLFTEETDMERAAYLEELRHVLNDKLDRLPERQQKAVVLRFFYQKSFDEIAAALDTTPGNVRVILSRAMDRLEKEFSMIKEDWSF